jgi:hypothetical protein
MTRVAEKLLSVSPLGAAALLILSRQLCEHLDLPAPDVAQILAATKTSRSAAYELAAALLELVPTIAKPRGRPPKPPAAAPADEGTALTQAVLVFVMRHPGSARAGERQGYSDGFRHFVLELRGAHAALDLEAFASATQVPLGTLKDWLRDPTTPAPEPEPAAPPAHREETDARMAQFQTVLSAYAGWNGTFVDFCEHVQRDLHVPFGRALVAQILHAHGARRPTKRGRQHSDELSMRGAFRTFFPGAQWVGDGMQVPVVVDGERFTFNLELNVDAHTSADVGLSVRDEEDAAAVVEALSDGVITTGALPLALLLDNKPANHTAEVDAALGDSIRIRATPARPQNKAHVEGAFGLFSQILPALVLDTQRSAHDIARALLVLVVTVWARTTNHRPRADRGGRSRVDLYAEAPSQEQLEEARRALRERADQQERARRTQEARCRPDVLALLDAHFARLALLDPERHIRLAIAGHPMNAIVNGLAIFEGKRRAGTLKEGVDARYLLGIVKNVATTMEGEHVARAMLELRLEARDRALAGLVAARVVVCAQSDAALVSKDCVARALETPSPLDRAFWLGALADVLLAMPATERHARFLDVARRIYATFAISPRERQDALRIVADRLIPVA